MIVCNELLKWNRKENTLFLETNGVEIRVLFLTDEIVRIRAGFDKEFKEESYTLLMTAWEDRMDAFLGEERKKVEAAGFDVEETAEKLTVTGKKLNLEIRKNPFQILIYDKEGICLHADIPDLAYREDSNHRRLHTSEVMEGDCFYGFGEKGGKINKAKQFLTMCPQDTMGYDAELTDSLYKHIPFYIKCNKHTKKASGYFYHTTYECDFDMGRSHSNYWKHHSTYRANSGDVDLFFIAGPTIAEVIERYTDLTGKSAMLPKYALGYLGSSMYYPELPKDCDKAIEKFIEISEKEGIPMDGFQLSSGYCELGTSRYVFTWNLDKFPDPARYFASMESHGITVSPNVKPGLLLTHPYLEDLKKEDIFVKEENSDNAAVGTWWGGKGVFVDFTNAHSREVWKKYLKENLLDYGVTSVWNDNCEYDSIVNKDARVNFEGKGATIGQLKSIMSNIMCKITDEALEEKYPGKRPFVVCRSGHAGIQRYAQTWAGDNFTSWKSLKYNIGTILGMGLSGEANHGCDVGGFYGPAPEEELFVRWVQNGIFMPRFSIHSTNTDNTVTEPWMYNNGKAQIRNAIQFRYRLIPYMYTLMEQANKTGLPIMRPTFMEYQNDENCYENGTDFLMGDSLLVSNVMEKGEKIHEVYLPKGNVFYDFYTRERYEGGTKIAIPVTMDSIPMFLPGGCILPLAEHPLKNLHAEENWSLHLIVAPDRDNVFELYEDDGLSQEYRSGMFCKQKIEMTTGEIVTLQVTKTGTYESKIEEIHLDIIHREKAPYHVWIDGEELEQYLYDKEFCEVRKGWYYDQTLKSVQVKYPNRKENYTVKVSFEQFDLLGM